MVGIGWNVRTVEHVVRRHHTLVFHRYVYHCYKVCPIAWVALPHTVFNRILCFFHLLVACVYLCLELFKKVLCVLVFGCLSVLRYKFGFRYHHFRCFVGGCFCLSNFFYRLCNRFCCCFNRCLCRNVGCCFGCCFCRFFLFYVVFRSFFSSGVSLCLCFFLLLASTFFRSFRRFFCFGFLLFGSLCVGQVFKQTWQGSVLHLIFLQVKVFSFFSVYGVNFVRFLLCYPRTLTLCCSQRVRYAGVNGLSVQYGIDNGLFIVRFFIVRSKVFCDIRQLGNILF